MTKEKYELNDEQEKYSKSGDDFEAPGAKQLRQEEQIEDVLK